MLKDVKGLDSNSKYHKISHLFVLDPRFRILEERDKENVFQDYMDDLYNSEKEE
jgi:hypothetical protein